MRRPITTSDAYGLGINRNALRWRVHLGTLQRLSHGVYVLGPEPPTPLEKALGVLVGTAGTASHSLAGSLYKLDAITLRSPFVTLQKSRETRRSGVRYRDLDPVRDVTVIDGYRCTNGTRTMIDLASILDDLRWEQALESALRKGLTTIAELEIIRNQSRAGRRIARVLGLRPPGAPPTESLLETLMVQLIRTEPSLPTPSRQVVVLNKWDRFVARVDLAWPDAGIFLELDGQQHAGQPVYDANRQTAVVIAKGWWPGRFTWYEVTRTPRVTLRRLVELFDQASQLRRTA